MSFRHFHILPPVIAHRGARCRAPENTMSAFIAAQEDGASWIETDVKLTADGVPILFHDDTLDRTTDGHGPVAEQNWADLQKLDAGNGTPIPRLEDLLRFAHTAGIRLNLELKPCPGRARATAMVALIEAARLWPETALPPLISSFDPDCLKIAAGLHPDWPRGLLLDTWQDGWRDLAIAADAASIHFEESVLTPDRIDACRDAGLTVLAYTVNDPARGRDLIRAGVAAVFTDEPGKMIRAL